MGFRKESTSSSMVAVALSHLCWAVVFAHGGTFSDNVPAICAPQIPPSMPETLFHPFTPFCWWIICYLSLKTMPAMRQSHWENAKRNLHLWYYIWIMKYPWIRSVDLIVSCFIQNDTSWCVWGEWCYFSQPLLLKKAHQVNKIVVPHFAIS